MSTFSPDDVILFQTKLLTQYCYTFYCFVRIIDGENINDSMTLC